jgi:DUF1365 family protein
MPRFLGYAFNPLTTYYVYDPDLIAMVLEVHNTFGEKHIYIVPPPFPRLFLRRFHVSPFNDRSGMYKLKTTSPENGIYIELTLLENGKAKLAATLTSRSEVRITDMWAVVCLCLLCGWWIFMSFPRILFEAWKLHYRRRLPVHMRPEPFNEKGTIHRQNSSSADMYSPVCI